MPEEWVVVVVVVVVDPLRPLPVAEPTVSSVTSYESETLDVNFIT